MKRNDLIILMLAMCLLGACRTISKRDREGYSSEKVLTETDIPYTIAEGYFQKNNIKLLSTSPIVTEEEFNSLFGMATTMGVNGRPTTIDFSKEYVIAVSKPETNYSTTLTPVSLKKDEKGNIVFTYKTIKGKKQSYSILPCLLIIIDQNQKGKLLLKEEK